MSARTVKTQAEFDRALADGVDIIDIKSPRGVWIEVGDTDSASVSAFDSASVSASDSASVRAFDSASVSASDSASVRAFDSASVRAFGSASVRAFDSASVRAFGSASVRAFGSASVRAFDSASVSAFDSASVSAFDSASVRAFGSASVRAFDSASVSAGTHVAVHLHSKRVTLDGGVLIDVTDLDLHDPATWAGHVGAEIDGNHLVLYKAVNDDLYSGYGKQYPIGATLVEANYADDNECGRGLHLCPTPAQAQSYMSEATRFLACRVNLADVSPVVGGTAKCKVRELTVLHEVDVMGRALTTEATA